MRVTVGPSLILWASVLFYLDGTLLGAFLLAAGLHELGHYLALRSMGRAPTALHLSFFGASMTTPPLSYRQELLAAAAGPAVSLGLGLLAPVWPLLAVLSLALGCFNLLPIPGLDGSRMLRCALLLALPPDPAGRICRLAALVAALALWGGALYLMLPGRMGLWPMLPAALGLYRALSMETL